MKRDRRLPLTETVYYILMCLIEPAHGYLIMSRVEEASDGQVRLAPGTLYGALENLSKQGLIARVSSGDSRRKVRSEERRVGKGGGAGWARGRCRNEAAGGW